jgi:hypothetical protein
MYTMYSMHLSLSIIKQEHDVTKHVGININIMLVLTKIYLIGYGYKYLLSNGDIIFAKQWHLHLYLLFMLWFQTLQLGISEWQNGGKSSRGVNERYLLKKTLCKFNLCTQGMLSHRFAHFHDISICLCVSQLSQSELCVDLRWDEPNCL